MSIEKYFEIIPEIIEELKNEYHLFNPIIRDDVFSILEKHCVVIYYPLDNETNCGFHIKRHIRDNLYDFVYINTAQPLAKQVFTAAHELGHVWNVKDKILKKYNENVSISHNDEEILINRFAAELLMPEDKFIKAFNKYAVEYKQEKNKIRLEDFIHVVVLLMNDFMVPYESVRRRVIETGIIQKEEGEQLKNNKETIDDMIRSFEKEKNTLLDQKTYKKTIPGIRKLIEKVEKDCKLDRYTLCKIKKDFDIEDLKDLADESVTIND